MRLLRSWALRGLGWFSLTEAVARLLLESGIVIAMWSLGLSLPVIVLGWLVCHTLAWLLFYGGFLGVYNLLALTTDVPRLERYRDRICNTIRRTPYFRLAFLSGSAARGEMNTRSDIDVLVFPGRSLLSKFLGILTLWRLRAAATLRLLPLEATWADTERYVPYFTRHEKALVLKRTPGPGGRRPLPRGILITLSGPDKEWTRGAAQRLVATWNSRGLSSVLIRPEPGGWSLREGGRRIAMEAGLDRIWRRIGRSAADLREHPRAKMIHDVLAWIDYVGLAWRLSARLQPHSIVVADGYLVDLLARLKSSGPMKVTVEGMFVGLSFTPDAAILLETPVSAGVAPQKAADGTDIRGGYEELGGRFGLIPVPVGESVAGLCERVERLLRQELGIALDSSRGGWRTGVPELLS